MKIQVSNSHRSHNTDRNHNPLIFADINPITHTNVVCVFSLALDLPPAESWTAIGWKGDGKGGAKLPEDKS